MAYWSFVVADTDGTHRSDWIRARNRELEFDLNGPATAKWESDGDDPGAIAASEITSDLLAYRDGQLMFRGRMGSTGDELDENRHTVQWAAVDYRGLLWRRNVFFVVSKTATEQTAIGWALIDNAQQDTFGAIDWGGDMGITDASTATGRTRDRTYSHGKSIGEALTQLGDVIDGFDWDISPNLEYRTWYPHRGSSAAFAAVHGDTVTRVRREVDTSDYATDVFGYGATNQDTNLTSMYLASAPSSRGPGGHWDANFSNPSVTVAATLQEQTEADRLRRSVITPSYECTLRAGVWAPSVAWLGDTTELHIDSGRLNVHTTGRIVAIRISIGGSGEETVTITYDRRPISQADQLAKVMDLLAALNLR